MDLDNLHREQTLYVSENGDAWHLCRHKEAGRLVVLHEPNARSGGRPAATEVADFLREGRNGPEHQALRNALADLAGIAAP